MPANDTWDVDMLSFQTVCIDGLLHDCGISSALAMEMLQSCTKPLVCYCYIGNKSTMILTNT